VSLATPEQHWLRQRQSETDGSAAVLPRTARGAGRVVPVAPESRVYKADTVIISDVHLGSEVSQARLLRQALKEWYPFRRLIILGDLFEDLNFSRLSKHHFRLIDDLRRLTNRKRGVQVDWIEGNHDEDAQDIVRRMIGANVHRELIVEAGGKRYLFLHGHQFDTFLTDHPYLSLWAGSLYQSVQRREGETNSISRWLKKKSKGWIRVCQKVERKAIEYGEERGVDFVVCGHTHYHEATPVSAEGGVRYINTGCWTDFPCKLTTLGDEGMQHFHYH